MRIYLVVRNTPTLERQEILVNLTICVGCDVAQEKCIIITIIIKFNARSAINEFRKL